MPETSDSTDTDQHEQPLLLPDLPDVPLLEILSYLPRQDLLAAGLTCARLGALTRDNAALWTRSWPEREQGFDVVKGLSRVAPPAHTLRLALGVFHDDRKLPLMVSDVKYDQDDQPGRGREAPPCEVDDSSAAESPESLARGGLSWNATARTEDLGYGLILIRELGPTLTHLTVSDHFYPKSSAMPSQVLLALTVMPHLRSLVLDVATRNPPPEVFRDVPAAAIPALELLTLENWAKPTTWSLAECQQCFQELQDLIRRAPLSLHVTCVSKDIDRNDENASWFISMECDDPAPGAELHLVVRYGHPCAAEADCPLCAEAVATVRANHHPQWRLMVFSGELGWEKLRSEDWVNPMKIFRESDMESD
ncbi:hypothetical protein FOCC_FOCC017523 [Frankliniella occidentalis]|uniref:Uncharacterized protein LOC113212339 isoform X1 n=1 Tax=Frankliniella occidentalis TaxID=133901 RepID=A0A6J1T0N9_FRAOC|nr:uncharacterized protein LOC113212339 isoform X1 [Frankliniella occidentalis]KAE8737018.1 hypothetical protein FOCC_FOCC017523 [Frankliniella occidentalis]